MKHNILVVIFLVFSSTFVFGQSKSDEYLALENTNYIDVNAGKIVKNVSILIKNEKIVKIKKKIKFPKGTKIVNASGKYIVPGFIDSHIHYFQSGGLYTRPDALNLTKIKPYDEERKWLLDNFEDISKRYLKLGITTVIDVGGPLTNYDLKDKAKKDPNTPNVYVTGPLISTYQPEAFKIEDPPIIKVENADEAREQVRKQLPYKPDFIKIWYINLPNLPADSTYQIVAATIDESHKNKLPVAVHATQLNTAKLAVKAGADFLVHNVDDEPVDKEFINMLKKNKVILIPTLIVSGKYSEVFSQDYKMSPEDFEFANPFILGSLFDLRHIESHKKTIDAYKKWTLDNLKQEKTTDSLRSSNLKKLSDAGVLIATGTDAGNIGTHHASSYFEELRAMKNAGLTNKQILKASTINAAKVLNLEQSLGSIEEGKLADLIISTLNPLENLSIANSIEYVVKGGRLMLADSIANDTPEMLVQRQLNAYNARNMDAFLAPYATDVEIYDFPNSLIVKGTENMRKQYKEMFEKIVGLHCEIKKRTILGNTVIDHESISGFGPQKYEAIAIYKIKNGKIAKVYFID